MVEEYLGISDMESVSTAKALFIERDIDEGIFDNYIWRVTDSINIKGKSVTVAVIDREDNRALIVCVMTYDVYNSLIKDKVQKDIDYYLNFM